MEMKKTSPLYMKTHKLDFTQTPSHPLICIKLFPKRVNAVASINVGKISKYVCLKNLNILIFITL